MLRRFVNGNAETSVEDISAKVCLSPLCREGGRGHRVTVNGGWGVPINDGGTTQSDDAIHRKSIRMK
jgi:hypothetical protein